MRTVGEGQRQGARWKGWSGTRSGTSWCRSRGLPTGRCSTSILNSSAAGVESGGCAGTARRSASGSSATGKRLQRFPLCHSPDDRYESRIVKWAINRVRSTSVNTSTLPSVASAAGRMRVTFGKMLSSRERNFRRRRDCCSRICNCRTTRDPQDQQGPTRRP